jgi:SAM-dependent methyltransferase
MIEPISSAEGARCLACGSRDSTLWCKAHDVEYCTTPEEFSYRKCSACQVLSIDPVPVARLAEIYPPNYYSFVTPQRSFATRVKDWLDRRLFAKVLREVPGDSLAALDVGGGAGFQLDTVKSADARVRETHIVDLDPKAEKSARERGHVYHCSRVEDFHAERRFDLVLLLNLLEHVEAPGQLLERVASLLTPSGRVVLKTPNVDALDARLFRSHNWAGLHCPRHWVLFTRESLVPLAERCGLRVESFAYTQGAPFWTASTLAWLASHGLVQVSRERPAPYHPLFGLLNAFFAALDFARMPFSKPSQMFLILAKK